MSTDGSTLLRLKQIIVKSLNLEGIAPETIGDHTPLMAEGLGLDSVDALELVVHIEKEFGIRILNENIDQKVFASVASLAGFLDGQRSASNSAP
jgi:acyl carrier protein